MRTILARAGLENVKLVTTPGRSVESVIKKPTCLTCSDTECVLCSNNYPCRPKHQVQCNLCQNGPQQSYIGASRRRPIHRLKEHEASSRRFNNRTSIGQHMKKHHSDLEPDNITRKVNLPNFFTIFTPNIVERGKDTLDTFIREGLTIRQKNPTMYNMQGNGFVFT